MVEEIVLKGEPFDEQKKKWLKKYSEAEGLNYVELEGNLSDFFEALHDYQRTQANSIKKLLEILSVACFIDKLLLDKFLSVQSQRLRQPLFPDFFKEKKIILPETKFKTIKIGNQIWMAENLNVDRFRNGDMIVQVKSFSEWKNALKGNQPAYCNYDYFENGSKKTEKFYNKHVVADVRGIAPTNWHIPTHEEINELARELTEISFQPQLLGFALKQKGFIANPNCTLNSIGRFEKDCCYWWNNQSNYFGWHLGLFIYQDYRDPDRPPTGCFIRCILD